MQMTITEAAKLYRKQRKTLYRHIDAGRLSCSVRGDGHRVLDLSELIRCYGDPPMPPGGSDSPVTRDASSGDTLLTHAMLDELRALREEVAMLRQELRLLPAPRVDKGDTVDAPRSAQEWRQDAGQGDGTRDELRSLVDALRRQE